MFRTIVESWRHYIFNYSHNVHFPLENKCNTVLFIDLLYVQLDSFSNKPLLFGPDFSNLQNSNKKVKIIAFISFSITKYSMAL